MHTRLIIGMLIAALAVVTGVVVAQTTSPVPERGGPGMDTGMGVLPRIARELQLTPEQTQALMAIHREYMEQTVPVREQLRTEMRNLGLLWTNRQSTAADLRAQADVVDALKTQLRNTTIDYTLRARAVLTDQQLARIAEWINTGRGPGFGVSCPAPGGHGTMGGRAVRGGLMNI